MITNSEAEYLISLPKILKKVDYSIDLSAKKNRIELISPDDDEHEFFVELTSNSKICLKTSIHHQESIIDIGLLRIDFKGTHFNPNHELVTLPAYLKQYLNKHFTPDESHIHVYVEGYRPLAWAIPLTDYDFEPKTINGKDDIINLLYKFAYKINLTSILNIKTALF